MTLGPILPGRLPGSLIASNFAENITSVQDQLSKIEQQISSGQQFTLPSDNPQATSTALQLRQQLTNNSQFSTNLSTSQSFLQSTDSALQNVSTALSQANSLLLTGLGDTTSSSQKESLATQVDTIIQGLVNTANSQFQGRYLFGGSQSQTPPFTVLAGGGVRYNGDQLQVNSQVARNLTVANNIDGVAAFGAISTPVGSDLNPALTTQTPLSDLNSGRGVNLGQIQVTVNNNGAVTQTVDLTNAHTIADVQQAIQNAFPPGTLTVGISSAPPADALTVTAAQGTVSISDIVGGHTAADLGIAHAAASSIAGTPVDPQLSLTTPLSALNGGTGISQSHGIVITNGSTSQTVDVSSDVTVQDLFNTLQSADPNLDVEINSAGNGLAISTRLSGVNFSIGENGGNDATSLGIRTFTGSTLLSSLNLGTGVPVNATDESGNLLPADLQIQRRSGTTVQVDLAGAKTVQDVLDRINAVDPGKLVASLDSVGNGISIVDNDGTSTGPLSVASSPLATALGLVGTQSSTDPTQPLVGTDVNPVQANGSFNLLVQLSAALRKGDNATLTRLQPLFANEINRVSNVQGDLGAKEQLLSQVQTQLQDEKTSLTSDLSDQLDTNMADALTQFTQLTTSLQATLQITASSMQLSLFNFL